MLAVNGIDAEGAPMVHFAKRLDVLVWPLHRVR